MATHSSGLAWRIPTDREAWWTIVHRAAKSWMDMNELEHTHTLHNPSSHRSQCTHKPHPEPQMCLHHAILILYPSCSLHHT